MANKSRPSPLFSRNQLRLLIWILPIVILLLSLSGPDEPSVPAISSDTESRIYQLIRPQQEEFRLHLIAPRASASGAAAQLRQRLLSRALLARLRQPGELGGWLQAQGWRLQLQEHAGYRRLVLESPGPVASDQLKTFLQQLQIPPQIDWQTLLQQVQAEQYLARQSAEAWLHSQTPQTEERTLPLDPVAEYRQQLNPGHWRLTLTGPEPLPLQLPAATPVDIGAQTSASIRLSLQPLPVEPATSPRIILHRWPLPPIHTPDDFARLLLGRELVIQTLSLWLEQPRSPDVNLGYSLQWEPTVNGGLASLVLTGAPWPHLPEWLPRQISQADMARARQQLLTQLETATDLQPWMDLLALYRLPADSLQQLPEQLAEITPQAMRHWLQSGLHSDYYHSLSLPN